MAADTPDGFRPAASLETLRRRADLLRRVREFFDQRAFLEVETPCLSRDVVVDRHLDPLVTVLPCDVRRPHDGRPLYLQTSPEFHMKRLLAAGAGAIYQVAHAFRAGEAGPRHNPEFTLVEWYRPGDSLDAGMTLLGELCERLLARGPAERLSYAEAFERHVGLDPHVAELAALDRAVLAAGGAGLEFAADDRDGRLDYLLVTRVEPHLGQQRPTMLYDYPASQAALAQIRVGPTPVAERFELYVQGIELANGYHELLDADELTARNSANNRLRIADGKAPLPEESRLLSAMRSGLPASVGVALGFDRVVMLATGAQSIDEVLAFPIDRA